MSDEAELVSNFHQEYVIPDKFIEGFKAGITKARKYIEYLEHDIKKHGNCHDFDNALFQLEQLDRMLSKSMRGLA